MKRLSSVSSPMTSERGPAVSGRASGGYGVDWLAELDSLDPPDG